MSKTRSITELVNELQRENESLTGLKKASTQCARQSLIFPLNKFIKSLKRQMHWSRSLALIGEIQKPYYSSHISNES